MRNRLLMDQKPQKEVQMAYPSDILLGRQSRRTITWCPTLPKYCYEDISFSIKRVCACLRSLGEDTDAVASPGISDLKSWRQIFE